MGFEITNGSTGIAGALFIAVGIGAAIMFVIFLIGGARATRRDADDDPDHDLDA